MIPKPKLLAHLSRFKVQETRRAARTPLGRAPSPVGAASDAPPSSAAGAACGLPASPPTVPTAGLRDVVSSHLATD